MKKTQKLFSWVLILLAAMGMVACSQVEGWFSADASEPTPMPVVQNKAEVTAEGRALPTRYATLSFPIAGQLESLLVEEGDQVVSGDILSTIGHLESVNAEIKAAEAAVESAQQALDRLEENANLARGRAGDLVAKARTGLTNAQKAYNDTHSRDFQDRLDDKEEILQDRKEELDDARDTLDRYINLDVNNPTRVNAQNDLDDRQEAYDLALFERDQLLNQREEANSSLILAKDTLENAQRDYADLASGPDPDELSQAQKQLEAAEAQLDAALRRKADFQLIAPFNGEVAEVKRLEPGVWISPGQAILTLIDTSNWYVESTDLTELDVVKIEVGDEVSVVFDALPEIEVAGTVERIGRTYTERSGDILYSVRIELDNPPDKLRWGMTALLTFGE